MEKNKGLDSVFESLDKLTDFDPDFGSEHPNNIEAARARGWTYNPVQEAYVDEDGCLMADKFGQPF